MKKQTKIGLLLMAALLVWSIIGYQIIGSLNPPVPQTGVPSIKKHTAEKFSKQALYSLQENYRDPFLGGFPQKKIVVKKAIPKKETTPPFPAIVYNGMIQGSNSKSFILTINGNQEVLKLGDLKQQITLVSANGEEAVVRFQGIKKTVFLNK
jgi:hypothetical protein